MKLSITTQLHPTYPLIFISIPQCTINHTIRIPTTTQIYHRITSTQICMSLHHLSFITSATKSNKTRKWAIWTMVIPAETVFLQIIILILIQMCQNLLTLNAIPFTPQLTQFLPFFHPTILQTIWLAFILLLFLDGRLFGSNVAIKVQIETHIIIILMTILIVGLRLFWLYRWFPQVISSISFGLATK